MSLTLDAIDASSDDELLKLLGQELQERLTAKKNSAEFILQIRALPVGLRAMAATHQLDVSLALDDLGWHFGNWHNVELAEETAIGLEEVGAPELAEVFRASFTLAHQYWTELGSPTWTKWYHGSKLEAEMKPLNERARQLVGPTGKSIFKHWVDHARRHPDRVGVED